MSDLLETPFEPPTPPKPKQSLLVLGLLILVVLSLFYSHIPVRMQAYPVLKKPTYSANFDVEPSISAV